MISEAEQFAPHSAAAGVDFVDVQHSVAVGIDGFEHRSNLRIAQWQPQYAQHFLELVKCDLLAVGQKMQTATQAKMQEARIRWWRKVRHHRTTCIRLVVRRTYAERSHRGTPLPRGACECSNSAPARRTRECAALHCRASLRPFSWTAVVLLSQPPHSSPNGQQ